MKKIPKPIAFSLRFLPLAALIGILFYLGSINVASEVYIDLVSAQMSFDIAEHTDELIASVPLDSIQIFNCDLKLKLGKILNNSAVISERGSLRITGTDQEAYSQISPTGKSHLLFKKLEVPAGAKIEISKGLNYLQIELSASSGNQGKIRGELNTGGEFLFSGRNIQLDENNILSDTDILTISTHRFYKTLFFEANDPGITLILHVSPDNMAEMEDIIKDMFVKNISFVTINQSRRRNRQESSIRSGQIQIASADFFKKRFLLKQEELEDSDFLDIADEDQYFINFVKWEEKGFKISMFGEASTDLKKGRRVRLLRSISPSMLDFIMAEPSNKTLWAILVFILTQFATLRGIVKTQIEKYKSKKEEPTI
ncbi:MAG: hypothetical protein DRI57_03025 [Deltaproteobacteria bacterium]|nr:MAG: hypothetical protein DRI57_03025 [Deltaproteobacteria bacterium]